MKNNQPHKRINAGAISVTIWNNKGNLKDGTTTEFSTISLQRNYQDAQGNWQSTATMRVNDLPKAALALNKAFEFLTLRNQERNQEQAI